MKKIIKRISTLTFALMLVLTTAIPSLAAESSTISPWALPELTEGEKYGIYPMDWYNKDLTTEISDEDLATLYELTDAKLAKLNLDKKEGNEFAVDVTDKTREGIINGLYSILSQYDFTDDEDALSYMTDRKIIRGTGNSLELERIVTTEEAILFASRFIRDTYYQVEAGAKGVAWKVENNGNTVYLLGSIHIGTPDLYPFNEQLVSAYKDSDALAVELNLFDFEGLMYFMEQAVFQDGTTIKDVVSEATYEKLLQVFEKYELPVEEYSLYKPWSLASLLANLSEDEYFDVDAMANYGIDMYFLSDAVINNKPILELEGTVLQTDLFNNLSMEAQEEYLLSTIESILATSDSEEVDEYKIMQDWFNYWAEGNKTDFADSLNVLEAEPSELTEMLLGERDKNMAHKIMELLEAEGEASYFIVVGAAHFLTEQGILKHLEQNGYKIEEFYQ